MLLPRSSDCLTSGKKMRKVPFLWGDVDNAATPTGGRKRKQNTLFCGVARFKRIFKLKKSTPKELRGACLQLVL